MLAWVSNPAGGRWSLNSRLALEVLHDVEESVVYVGVLLELNLNLIKITKRILQGNMSAVR
jgi:hypothetical protein